MHHKYPELMSKYFSPYPPNRVPTSLYIQKVIRGTISEKSNEWARWWFIINS